MLLEHQLHFISNESGNPTLSKSYQYCRTGEVNADACVYLSINTVRIDLESHTTCSPLLLLFWLSLGLAPVTLFFAPSLTLSLLLAPPYSQLDRLITTPHFDCLLNFSRGIAFPQLAVELIQSLPCIQVGAFPRPFKPKLRK